MRAGAKVAAGHAICRREIGSASAAVLGRTSDNTLAYLTLTAVYDYRPSSDRTEYLDAQGRPHNEARGTLCGKEHATAAKHAWWPKHLHVSTTVGTLCRVVALTTLLGFDARAIEARGGGRLLAGAAHERASCVLPLWGVTSIAMMARAWVAHGANSPSALLCPRLWCPLWSPSTTMRWTVSLGCPIAPTPLAWSTFAQRRPCATTRSDTPSPPAWTPTLCKARAIWPPTSGAQRPCVGLPAGRTRPTARSPSATTFATPEPFRSLFFVSPSGGSFFPCKKRETCESVRLKTCAATG
ncbi:hypothetical protein TW95_gp0369 [Pandoravirus inopinatum]|uniref:Uncharacterized protein n=1 Tax=Pandoravirus inopinatum TaxID=1605721 RepID=A0A0B5IWM4_9VIRU|nr:hypothetical protein TW95_gp0369 [Pandoravirus inopinatum]AJF97103.1 hypothetical protein [Pandoravirus inopinatum]